MKLETEIVRRCIARHDGAWMVVTQNNRAAVAAQELQEGQRIVIRDGRAERLRQ